MLRDRTEGNKEHEVEFLDVLSEVEVFDDCILLIPFRMKETHGIVLTKNAEQQQVISVCIVSTWGPDVQNEELRKEGTIVVIPRHTGKWIPFEGELYILVHEDQILGILEDAELTVKKEESDNELDDGKVGGDI